MASRKIKMVAVKYEDDSVEVFYGTGTALESTTHDSPSRDAPTSSTPMINFMQLHLQISRKETRKNVIVQ